jgi:hypothetical protein
MEEKTFKIDYQGSIGWLIFWLIIFFPIALTLLMTSSKFRINQTEYSTQYEGSRFWLCFWVVFFFPIAILLLILNGFSLKEAALSESQA